MKVLVVYYTFPTGIPYRPSRKTHIFCFDKFSDHTIYYFNAFRGELPWYLKAVDFDVIIFQTTFVCQQWRGTPYYRKLFRRFLPLANTRALKIMFPQDEFLNTDGFCDLINELNVDYVFSVAPEQEWKNIYHKVDFSKVKFERVLTAYLDDNNVAKIEQVAKENPPKTLDIGYRAAHSPPWFGRFGELKIKVAEVFQQHAGKFGLITNISTRKGDTFLGDDWYRFLMKSKYQIGVEGGASVIDRDGVIKNRTEKFLRENPKATFEEAEAACFQGEDGKLALAAISPRHLECAATRTCQVLMEGEYNGILKPWVHYIPFKKDFSDIDDVLAILKKDELREQIVEQTYQDIVRSGLYSYKAFVKFVFDRIATDVKPTPASAWERTVFDLNKKMEQLWVGNLHILRILFKFAPALIPARLLHAIKEKLDFRS